MYSRAYVEELQSCTRGYFYTSDEEALEHFARQENLRLEYEWKICAACRGEGTQALHGLVLGPEETSDPDFMEDYMSGKYDTACEDCKDHPGRIKVAKIDAWPKPIQKKWEIYLRGVHRDNDESLMEKRMGC